MIQIIQAPALNRVLLDGNTTNIIVKSTNTGATHYFRAKIYVNNVLFDEQSWSRNDNFTATKDLRYFYYAYYQTQFSNQFTNGLVEQTHLKTKIDITVEEYTIQDDTITQTVDLPTFYMLYNVKSQEFNDNNVIELLGIDTTYMRIDATGSIVIPFFANTNNQPITVTTILDNNTVLNTETIAATTAKKVYKYTYNLTNIAYSTLYVKTTITIGEVTKTIIYKLMRHQANPAKEVVFKNNFGYYIPAYFSGALIIDSAFKADNYGNLDYSETVFAIEENQTYTINTNYLLTNETPIITQINNALETYLKYNNAYLKINTTTKKQNIYTDKTHLYSEKLKFQFKKGLPLNNNGFIEEPTVTDISITGDENAVIDLLKTTFEAAYTSDYPIQSITIHSLPAIGSLNKVILPNEVYAVASGDILSWAAGGTTPFDKLTFQSAANDSGTPYTTFTFSLQNEYSSTEVKMVTLNITDLPDINLPPVITRNNTEPLFMFGSGTTIQRTFTGTTVVDPENDTFTVLWDWLGTPTEATITDETTLTPTITVTNNTESTITLRITATDVHGNSAVLLLPIYIGFGSAALTATLNSQSGTQRIYDVLINNGLQSETIEIEFDYDVYSANKYVAVNSDSLDEEFLVTLQNRKQTITKIFDAAREVRFQLTIEDSTTPAEPLKIAIANASGGIIIDKTNDTVTL